MEHQLLNAAAPNNNKDSCGQINNPLTNDPYFPLICQFLSTTEVINNVSHLSSWNYYYFKGRNNSNIEYGNANSATNTINTMFKNEFGDEDYFCQFASDTNQNNSNATGGNYLKVKKLYNQTLAGIDLLMTFQHNGLFAFKPRLSLGV